MFISWAGWSVSDIVVCFVILPENDPLMEGIKSLFLSFGECLAKRAECEPRLGLCQGNQAECAFGLGLWKGGNF
jgi:hypothetical protein